MAQHEPGMLEADMVDVSPSAAELADPDEHGAHDDLDAPQYAAMQPLPGLHLGPDRVLRPLFSSRVWDLQHLYDSTDMFEGNGIDLDGPTPSTQPAMEELRPGSLASSQQCDSPMELEAGVSETPWQEALTQHGDPFYKVLCISHALVAPEVSPAEAAELCSAGAGLLAACPAPPPRPSAEQDLAAAATAWMHTAGIEALADVVVLNLLRADLPEPAPAPQEEDPMWLVPAPARRPHAPLPGAGSKTSPKKRGAVSTCCCAITSVAAIRCTSRLQHPGIPGKPGERVCCLSLRCALVQLGGRAS